MIAGGWGGGRGRGGRGGGGRILPAVKLEAWAGVVQAGVDKK